VNRGVRFALPGALCLVAIASCWRLATFIRSDAALDRGDVEAALRYRPDNPEALQRRAAARMASGNVIEAESDARRMLRASPADGRGYRVLAQVAERRGDARLAARLYAIAVKRAPRDLEARAWLAQHEMAAGRYRDALEHIDSVLTMSSWSARTRLFPVLIQLAQDRAFADALADTMAAHPHWREGFLLSLLEPKNAGSPAADQVFAGLQRRNDLAESDSAAWIEALILQRRWGEAFARWASPHVAAGRSLPLLFNGDFSGQPSGGGFDWRVKAAAGVMSSVEPRGNAGMLHLRFLGRRVDGGALIEHALMLAPGGYVMAWEERMEAMRAGVGVAWRVSCAGQATALGQAEALQGSRAWQARNLTFTVPATGCPAQWLQFASIGDPAAGQVISGDTWFSGMRVTRERIK